MALKIALALLLVAASEGITEIVQMKIVDQISSYGYSNFGPDSSQKLLARVKPSNFSGPDHFRILKGKCFTLKLNEYKYKFCPFDNVTQHEQTYRWNPYSGILGVWKEWNIVNNTFHSMIMANGDSCGTTSREVEVVLSCGKANNLTTVTEPKTCSYMMTFHTPLACHEDSLLVYPRMNGTLREEWDELEQWYYDKEVTEKGYKTYLRRILWKAGFITEPGRHQREAIFKPFDSLETCNKEYHKLLEKVQKYQKGSDS